MRDVYLLFSGESQPFGGWDDLAGIFETEAEARAVVRQMRKSSWWHEIIRLRGTEATVIDRLWKKPPY